MSELRLATRPYVIAIDYDDTFSTCPETWSEVIKVLRANNARVVCCTFRPPEWEIKNFPGDVFYTSGKPKWQYMRDQGIDVKIWIDDQPALIGENPDAKFF